MKKDSIKKFSGIIKSVEFSLYDPDPTNNTELYKAKLLFEDETVLYITERYRKNKLEKYSYYWFTSANNKLIICWDSAPHHTHLKTFPHHMHLAGKEKPVDSDERNLTDVLTFIAGHLQ